MMRKAAAALFSLILISGRAPEPDAVATYTFGLSLMTGMNNDLFTLFEVKEFEGQVLEARPITRGRFVQEAVGAIPSRANSSGINLFKKYSVHACLLPPELDDGKRVVSDCGVLDELWKLRFWEYPFNGGVGQGWAESRTQPSPRQMMLLANYGFYRLQDMICGEDLFRLLHDISDPEWVDNYRKGY